MDIQINVQDDEFFKFNPKKEEAPQEQVVETTPAPQIQHTGPKPVPINNHSTSSVHWFEGTPWSTNNNF
jgi:hypothetical protein